MSKAIGIGRFVTLINGVPMNNLGEGGDVIKVERLNPSATHKMSADGKMTIHLSADRSGKMTLKLMQSADQNTYLQGLIDLQEGGPDTWIPVFFTAKDMHMQDMALGSAGYMEKPSDMTRGADVNEQEWVFIVEDLQLVYGAASVPDV